MNRFPVVLSTETATQAIASYFEEFRRHFLERTRAPLHLTAQYSKLPLERAFEGSNHCCVTRPLLYDNSSIVYVLQDALL